MASARTLATLVATSHGTNETEIITIILSSNNLRELTTLVDSFCLEKNITLFLPPRFNNWSNVAAPNEFRCEVCNQDCLQQTIDFNNLQATERFCSNFCRHAANTL